jgi:formylglycine-generating enzyme required for sulfatase activity
MFNEGQGEYLCLSRNTPVVRYIELPQSIQPLKVKLPLRILGMVADPSDLPQLDVEGEKQRIEKAVESLQKKDLLELTWLPGQTWRDLQQAMWSGPWHIFHFIGHGGFDAEREEGLVCLTDEDGKKQFMSATQLGRLLADHGSLRFVLLNACEGARGGNRDIFSSCASILVERGIPAVLAMQYEITDKAAIEFARTFYKSLTYGDGQPIDTATTEARKAVSFAINNTLEWGTPVLYMRSPDGTLFSIDRESEVMKKQPKKKVEVESEEGKSPFLTVPTNEESEDLPAELQAVKQQAKKVCKNDSGYWEAEFDYGIVMVHIPAGEFIMGPDDGDTDAFGDEKPEHKVHLDGYWIGKYELTVGQFKEFVNDIGYQTEAEANDGAYVYSKGESQKKKDANWLNPYYSQGDNHPVVCVSWNDAQAYIKWLSKKTGLSFKLPTEAQWEKAARGTDGRVYPWGKEFDKNKCNFYESNLNKTTPVGKFPEGASPYGCLDMAGNVLEWCSDWFADDYYKVCADEMLVVPDSGTPRVLRGGSWNYNARSVHCAFRLRVMPAVRDYAVGFRLCQDLSTKRRKGVRLKAPIKIGRR